MDPALRELLRAEPDEDPERRIEAIIRRTRPGVSIPGVDIVADFGTVATCRLRACDVAAVHARDDVASLKAARPLGGGHRGLEGTGDGQSTLGPSTPRRGDLRRPSNLTVSGANVVVAAADWGIDYDAAVFRRAPDPSASPDRDPAGGATRFLAIWDQRDQAAEARPAPYGYGTVHRRADIDRALRSPRPYAELGLHPAIADAGHGAHGTHVLDIAAGNGRTGGPAGLAPEADLIFVHLADRDTGGLFNLGDSVRLLEAVDFIVRTAAGRPWVINLSLGRCGGPHDGTTLVELALDELLATTSGGFIVQSAGNYFLSRTHASGFVASGEQRSFSFPVDPEDATPNELEIWYSGADEMVVRVDPPGHLGAPVELGDTAELVVGDRVVARIYHRECDPNNGRNHIDAFLLPVGCAGTWTVTLEGRRVTSGRYDAWLERDDVCPRCQVRFEPADADRTSSTGTIANGHLPIVVGAYDGHDPTRPIARFSSAGPTGDGRHKPDCLAPGVDVIASRSAAVGTHHSSGLHVRKSGTSMATPHVTGAVALCLQQAGHRLSAAELRHLVLASCDAPRWGEDRPRAGYGYLNVPRLLLTTSLALTIRAEALSSKDSDMDTDDLLRLVTQRPSTAYREYVYRPDGATARWIDDHYAPIALPGEAPTAMPREGDVLLTVALGEPGVGRCSVLDGSTIDGLRRRGRAPHGELLLRPRQTTASAGGSLPMVDAGVIDTTWGDTATNEPPVFSESLWGEATSDPVFGESLWGEATSDPLDEGHLPAETSAEARSPVRAKVPMLVLAGPIVRRAEPGSVWFWFASSEEIVACVPSVSVFDSGGAERTDLTRGMALESTTPRVAKLGDQLWVVLVEARPTSMSFTPGWTYGYDLLITPAGGTPQRLRDLVKDISYRPFDRPTFMVGTTGTKRLAHGSCRRPGADGPDAYQPFDTWLASEIAAGAKGNRPTGLLLTGDQIYADDVAYPLFEGVQRLARDLFGYVEEIPWKGEGRVGGMPVDQLTGRDWRSRADSGPTPRARLTRRQPTKPDRPGPIGFSTEDGEGHLLSFAEFAAMYVLVSNPDLWRLYVTEAPHPTDRGTNNLIGFGRAVVASRRVLANNATYMLFDDHEITDDWNLDRDWQVASQNPTARRVIANGLAAYWAFQAWGNDPGQFDPSFVRTVGRHLEELAQGRGRPGSAARGFDDALHARHWSYVAPTQPPALCVDTRTRREFEGGQPAVLSGPKVWNEIRPLLARARFPRGEPLLVVLPTPLLPHRSMLKGQSHRYDWPKDRYEGDFESYGNNPAQRPDLIQFLRSIADSPAVIVFSGDVHHGSVVDGLYVGGPHLRDIYAGRGAWGVRVAQVTSSAIKNVNRNFTDTVWWTAFQTDAGFIGQAVVPQYENQYKTMPDGTKIAVRAEVARLAGPLGRATYVFENHLCVVDLSNFEVRATFVGAKDGRIALASTHVSLANNPSRFQPPPKYTSPAQLRFGVPPVEAADAGTIDTEGVLVMEDMGTPFGASGDSDLLWEYIEPTWDEEGGDEEAVPFIAVAGTLIAAAELGVALFDRLESHLLKGAFTVNSAASSYIHNPSPRGLVVQSRVFEFPITAHHPRYFIDTQTFWFKVSLDYDGFNIRRASIIENRARSSTLVSSDFSISFTPAAYTPTNEPVAAIAYDITGRWNPIGRGDENLQGRLILDAAGNLRGLEVSSDQGWVRSGPVTQTGGGPVPTPTKAVHRTTVPFSPAGEFRLAPVGLRHLHDWFRQLPAAIQHEIRSGSLPIRLTGRTSTTGDEVHNQRLGRQRAESVASAFRDIASSSARFIISSQGELEARTPDRQESASERRVDVEVSYEVFAIS